MSLPDTGHNFANEANENDDSLLRQAGVELNTGGTEMQNRKIIGESDKLMMGSPRPSPIQGEFYVDEVPKAQRAYSA
jgi:hypothetical protein